MGQKEAMIGMDREEMVVKLEQIKKDKAFKMDFISGANLSATSFDAFIGVDAYYAGAGKKQCQI